MTIVLGWATRGNWALSAGGYLFTSDRLMPVKTKPQKAKWYTLTIILMIDASFARLP
jgi:hypothetical protein